LEVPIRGVLKGGEIPPLSKKYKCIDITQVRKLTPKLGQREVKNSPPSMVHYLAAETMNLTASLHSSNVNIDALKKDFGTTLNVAEAVDQQSDL